ncbi:hypothetical protein FOTG_19068 [Fusarium oxysporum f. sp. vasinfectum 25433]|uniref:Uncharacterized protein n=1 Tax=Fusarium oxysporum f. sp. vasinfectum 25433 TaxID=1089449 RepID=X0KUT1_FUSOX|nr:hypothetical protein FOTG_19068 [Fusarium oxysporum f. sp. vasinfectum 25433]
MASSLRTIPMPSAMSPKKSLRGRPHRHHHGRRTTEEISISCGRIKSASIDPTIPCLPDAPWSTFPSISRPIS